MYYFGQNFNIVGTMKSKKHICRSTAQESQESRCVCVYIYICVCICVCSSYSGLQNAATWVDVA